MNKPKSFIIIIVIDSLRKKINITSEQGRGKRIGEERRGGETIVYLSWVTAESAYSKAPAHQTYKRCALLLLLLSHVFFVAHVLLHWSRSPSTVWSTLGQQQQQSWSRNCFDSVDWPVSNRTAANCSRGGSRVGWRRGRFDMIVGVRAKVRILYETQLLLPKEYCGQLRYGKSTIF